MSAPLACPHCRATQPPSPPGVLYCGRCGGPYTVPTEAQRAQREKKRRDDAQIVTLIGGTLLVVYVAPLALMIVYLALNVLFAVVMVLGVGLMALVS